LQTLVFDVETNGLLEELHTIWCLLIGDPETGIIDRYSDHGLDVRKPKGPLAMGVERLAAADRLVAHNGIGYDLPAIEKVTGVRLILDKLWDTMVIGRLFDPERQSHALESYGNQFKMPKGEYTQWCEDNGIEDPWSAWRPEMEDYCDTDVRITMRLWQEQEPRIPTWGRSVRLEHDVAHIIRLQMENGFMLDVKKAQILAAELLEEKTAVEKELADAFPPWYVALEVFTPKKPNAKMGYMAGVPFTKVELQPFNPGSGKQIAERFKSKYKWRPRKFTDGGAPATDEEVIKSLPYPEAKLLARYMRVEKQWSQIAGPPKKDGSGGGWLFHVKNDGKVHGCVNSNGAVTGRMTHSKPNTANIDKKDVRMRELWIPRPPFKLVGCDAEGLELRMLAHYLWPYDDGAYARALLEGKKEDKTDVHSMTQKIIGLYKRDNAKRVIYAMIYGAGDPKIGLIIAEDALEAGQKPPTNKKQAGADARYALETGIKGLADIKKAISKKVKRPGYLIGLDGRHLNIRSEHAALNTLLQGAGAIVMKEALRLQYIEANKRWKINEQWAYCANVHDEVQSEVEPSIADAYGQLFADCIKEAGVSLGVRCALAGAYDIGNNWGDTH